MSCAYRTHRYRASVTAHPTSVSWQPPMGHARHPIPLHPLVVHPGHHLATRTEPPADDTPVSLSLVQYLWSQWQAVPSSEQHTVVAILGELMLSPRWHWDVTVLPDQSPPDPQRSFVSERDGRPTIGMPITMLQELWRWVLGNINKRAAVLRWLAPTIDPALWQELRAHRPTHGRWLTEQDWYRLYGYLSPLHLPKLAQETYSLLHSHVWNDQRIALTILDRWMASDDHATRDLAAQMLRAWLNQQAAADPTNDRLQLQAIMILSSSDDPAVVSTRLCDLLRTAWDRITPDDVRTGIDLLHGRGDGRSLAVDRWMSLIGEMVRDRPSDVVTRTVLDRLMPTILASVCTADRVAWAATLWEMVTDPTLDTWRRRTIATALTPMMQDPMVAALVHAQLCTEPSLHQTLPAPIRDALLAGLIHTAHADAVLRMIVQEIRQNPTAIARFDSILAAGWGHGYDHRILQIIDSLPGPHWETVLTEGITTSVGAEVCARIQAWFSRNQAMALIVDHIHDREGRGDWPLAPLLAHLIPWVGAAARARPYRLHSTTIRRLWLADPVRAWNVTQTMLHSDDSSVQQCAIAAMDAGWGRGHDDTLAATLREFIPNSRNPAAVESGIATAVAGIGRAVPSLIESLLTHLATTGNEDVRRQLISALRRGWGRGQDDLVVRVLATIADRTSSARVWDHFHETLIRAWDYQPSPVVMHLIDWLLTHAMNGLANGANNRQHGWMVSMAEAAITAFAPIWTHLPTPLVIERIAHHVAHLHAHTHFISSYERNRLVSAWTRVIAAGMERLSAADIHAVLAPLWNLSPDGCLAGVAQWVDR